MRARGEVAERYATEYANAPKHVKSQILDEVCRVTEWSRDNARRRLAAKASAAAARRRKPGPAPGARRYSSHALKVPLGRPSRRPR
ncbi:MAG: hypothetical protein LBD90_05965 [Bifidobacteriaceae bacterium]|jgi:hypothetical protein|nr:hypothetical protein [Bifidobacteriaceae bacterium]